MFGPILFNLRVADMKSILNASECIQYARNSAIYRGHKIKELCKCTNDIVKEFNKAARWSKDAIFFQSKQNKSNDNIVTSNVTSSSHLH